MGDYITTSAMLWEHLGKDAFTKVRSEVVGTGNATTSTWELDHDNVITSSQTLYTDGTAVPTASYSINLDDGKITGLTASSSEVLTADYNYGDLPDSTVQKIISYAEKELDERTGRNFSLNTGEVEYLDVDGQDVFFLSNYPVITFSSVEVNTAEIVDAPSWNTSTEGLGNDYLGNAEDREIGRIRYIDNKPASGQDRIKVTYNWGYVTVSVLAEELALLLAERKMYNSAIYKAIFKGQDNYTPVRLEEIELRIQELMTIFRKQNFSIA